MRSAFALLAVALLGLFGATSIGYAAYVVSRDSVGLPVTKLKLSPNKLAPAPTEHKAKAAKPKPRTTPTVTTTATTATSPTPPRTTTTDDHGGRSPSSRDGGRDD